MAKDRIIMGVDPGTNILGYGIIEVKSSKIEILTLGVLKLNGYQDHALKLKKIFDHLSSIIKHYCPDEFAIEAPFFGKNVQSMLKLGRAQGVAIAAALSHEIAVSEYSPKKIKQAVTGNGNASKEQVAAMLEQELDFKEDSKYLDATDGLATALCHYYQSRSHLGFPSKANDWASFLKNNPDKLA